MRRFVIVAFLTSMLSVQDSWAAPEFSGYCDLDIPLVTSKRVKFVWPGAGNVWSIFADGEWQEYWDWGSQDTKVLDPGSHVVTCAARWFWEGHTIDVDEDAVLKDVKVVDGKDCECFYGYKVEILSSSIRENDPTVMDVTYVVYSDKPTVKVRALAFEDGERRFEKVVRPETFIDGTASNIGDTITPNVEHKLSWRVSSDWSAKLAKVKFEVLACVGDVLPLELMTIPASGKFGKMKVSQNKISDRQVFDALLWLYADKDPGLVLTAGSLIDVQGVRVLAYGESLDCYVYNAKGDVQSYIGKSSFSVDGKNATEYVFTKLGYGLLSGAVLDYVNEETRLGLEPVSTRQYAYKILNN